MDVREAWTPRRLVELLGIALLNLALWGSTIGYEFVFDDLVNVLGNPWIRTWHALPQAFAEQAAGFAPGYDTSFYRPFMHVCYALAYQLAGPRPWAFHLLNVGLHVVATMAVYGLTDALRRRWLGDIRYSTLPLLSALVFSVHPVHTEAVAWIAGITDVSYTAFGLLALMAYVRAWDSRGVSVWPGLLLLASLLSKETGAVVLLVMMLLEWLEAGRDSGWTAGAAVRRLAAPAIFALIYVAMRFQALGAFAPSARLYPHSVVDLVSGGLRLLARYMGALVAPVGLNVMRVITLDRGFADPAASVGLVLAVVSLVFVIRSRRLPLASLAAAMAVAPILPALYFPAIESGWSVFGERYLYLPVLGVAWGVALLFAEASQRPTWVRGLSSSVLVVLLVAGAAASLHRSLVWASPLALWTDAAAKSPESAAAQEGRCHALYVSGRFPEALQACDRAIAIDWQRTDARLNRANVLLVFGKPLDAVRELDVVIRMRPDSAEAHTNRGLACMMLGRVDEALASYRRALVISPEFAEAHNDLGVALVRIGRTAEARGHFEQAVRLAPDSAEYRMNLNACPR